MTRLLGLSIFVLVGCASTASSQSSTTATRSSTTNRDRVLIQKAYAERNAAVLRELLDIAADPDDRAAARGHYVSLQLDALVELDCTAFAAAFDPAASRPVAAARKGVHPHTEFGALTAELEPAQQAYVASKVLGAAARCSSSLLFSSTIRRVVPDADVSLWSDALIALERDGLPVYHAFLGALRSTAKRLDPDLIGKWLVATRTASDCAELEGAARLADPSARAALAFFYTQKGCRTESTRALPAKPVGKRTSG